MINDVFDSLFCQWMKAIARDSYLSFIPYILDSTFWELLHIHFFWICSHIFMKCCSESIRRLRDNHLAFQFSPEQEEKSRKILNDYKEKRSQVSDKFDQKPVYFQLKELTKGRILKTFLKPDCSDIFQNTYKLGF